MLGGNRFPIWVHRGEQLETCQAMKLRSNVMNELVNVIRKVGQKGPVQVIRKKDGEVVIFGETAGEDENSAVGEEAG